MAHCGQILKLSVLILLIAAPGLGGSPEGSTKAILVVDDFEDCNIDGWLPAAGACTALATSLNPGGGVCSMELINSCGSLFLGWNFLMPSFQADSISVSLRSQSTSMSDTFFVVGEDAGSGFWPAVWVRAGQGGYWIISGTGGGSCGPVYTALQWYDFEFTIHWTTKTLDVKIDGSQCLTGVSFVDEGATTFNRIHVFNLDASAGWYDDIIMTSNPPLPPIFIDGFETGDTTLWSLAVP